MTAVQSGSNVMVGGSGSPPTALGQQGKKANDVSGNKASDSELLQSQLRPRGPPPQQPKTG